MKEVVAVASGICTINQLTDNGTLIKESTNARRKTLNH